MLRLSVRITSLSIVLNLLACGAWATSPSEPDLSVKLNNIKIEQKVDSLKITLPVTKFVLKNGLTVLLSEDHSVPMLSYHTWYRVGSRDEAPGVTGAAHMLEHMMFKGAKKYDGKSFDRIFHENGITNNAFTTYDYTGFFESLPSSKLELVMDMEVDRMSSLALRPEDLKSEREVVKEERRWRVDDNPMELSRELMMNTLFKVSSYRWPVIGEMADINNYNTEKLRFFYNTFYVPNNAVLVIVGDFETNKVKIMIEKYYGSLSYKPMPRRKYLKEPSQGKFENASLKKEVQNSSFILAYKGPEQGHPDMYALDLAANILGSGTSSRMHKNLVYDKQLATSAYAFSYSLKNDGIFALGANVNPGLGIQSSLAQVYQELGKIKNTKVSVSELQKAKTQVIKEFVDNLKTSDGKARALAVNEIVSGSYSSLFSDLDKYEMVTAEDITRVLKKYIKPDQRALIVLEPKENKKVVK